MKVRPSIFCKSAPRLLRELSVLDGDRRVSRAAPPALPCRFSSGEAPLGCRLPGFRPPLKLHFIQTKDLKLHLTIDYRFSAAASESTPTRQRVASPPPPAALPTAALMYRELSHPVPAALLPAPASVPAPAPVLAPAPDLCGASTRAECAAVGCLTSLVALFGAHCPSPSQASHASHHSRPRARQLGVVSARYQFAHLLTRLYALRRLLQRHPTVRSVAPPTLYHAPSDEGGRCLLAGVGRAAPGEDRGRPSRAYRVVA